MPKISELGGPTDKRTGEGFDVVSEPETPSETEAVDVDTSTNEVTGAPEKKTNKK